MYRVSYTRFDEFDLLHADSDADREDDDGLDVQISSSSTIHIDNISRRGNHKRNMFPVSI